MALSVRYLQTLAIFSLLSCSAFFFLPTQGSAFHVNSRRKQATYSLSSVSSTEPTNHITRLHTSITAREQEEIQFDNEQ